MISGPLWNDSLVGSVNIGEGTDNNHPKVLLSSTSSVAITFMTSLTFCLRSHNGYGKSHSYFMDFAGWMCEMRKLGAISIATLMRSVPMFSSKINGMLSSTGTFST